VGTGLAKLPPGAQFAVLLGIHPNPEPVCFQGQTPDGYSVAPHWHSMDENVTVISGVFRVDEHALRDLPAGILRDAARWSTSHNRILLSIGSTEFRADKENGLVLVLSYWLRWRRARGRLKLNFLIAGLLFLRVYLRAIDIVVRSLIGNALKHCTFQLATTSWRSLNGRVSTTDARVIQISCTVSGRRSCCLVPNEDFRTVGIFWQGLFRVR